MPTQLSFCGLLHGVIDGEVHAGANGVTHRMQAEAGVQPSDSMALDDLLDCRDGTKARLVTQRMVPSGIRSCHCAVGDQYGGLNDILRQFKGACVDVSPILFIQLTEMSLQARGEANKPEIMPAVVKVITPSMVGLLPGRL